MGVLYARVNGQWVPVAPAGTVIPPAYAGPRRISGGQADAFFGQVLTDINSIDTGFAVRPGMAWVQLGTTGTDNNVFAVYDPVGGQILELKAKAPTLPRLRIIGEINATGGGAALIAESRDNNPPNTQNFVIYVQNGLWRLFQGNNDVLQVNTAGDVFSRLSLNAGDRVTAIKSNQGPYSAASFLGNSGNAAMCMISCTVPGYAPQWRCYTGEGEMWTAVNSGNTVYVPIGASEHRVVSSATIKRGIRALRPEREHIVVRPQTPLADVVEAPDIMALRPVAFRPKEVPQRIVRHEDYRSEDESTWHYEDEPEGSVFARQNTRERLGLIAEEVAEVVPSAVSHREDGSPNAIDYAQITVALLDHVQELTRTVETLRYRITELEGQRP